MTFSVLIFDRARDEVGAAIAGPVPFIGSRSVFSRFQTGIVITQSMPNPWLARRGLDLMQAGLEPEKALSDALSADPDVPIRQVHAMDFEGATYAMTGEGTPPFSGCTTGGTYSVAGSNIKGDEVLFEMEKAIIRTEGDFLSNRLLACLEAGQAAGGHQMALRSGAIRVLSWKSSAEIDLREDDDADPVTHLVRLKLALKEPEVMNFRALLPDESDAESPHHKGMM